MSRLIVSCAVLLLAFSFLVGCSGEAEKVAKNKDIVLKAGEAINNKEYDRFKDFFAEDFRRHSQATPDIEINSLAEMITFVKEWDQVFPDAKMEVRLMAAEEDLVAIWGTYTGTHEAPMGQFPATGKKIESETFAFFRMEQGKIAEIWITWDNAALLNQLGLFPEAPTEEP